MAVNMEKIREIAINRLKSSIQNEGDLIEMLKIWWVTKFNLPDNHPLFLAKTLEELVLDYETDNVIREPNVKTKKELAEEERQLQEDMGEDYHAEPDYLEAPPQTIVKKSEDIDEDFESAK